MGWSDAKEAAEKVKSGLFINLANDGDKAVICFPFTGDKKEDDPYVLEMFWDDKLEKNVPYTAEHKAAGKDPSPKYKFNVHEKDDGDPLSLKIFECTTGTFKAILEAKEKYAPQHKSGLAAIYLEIKRHGAAKSKKTKYSVLYDGPVPDDHIAKLQAIPAKDRPDLTKSGDDDADDKKSKTNGASAASASTIDETTFQRLSPKLKEMADDKRKQFLKDFGIQRLRELKTSDVARAEEWVTKNGPAAAASAGDFD